jgi:hypothetical protein
MRAIFGDEAVESGPHLRTRAATRGPSGRKLPDVPYFPVVFTVLDEEKEKPMSVRGRKYSLATRALGL